MSNLFNEVAAKLDDVKIKVEGDLKLLVEKLEAVFHHVQASSVEDVVKNAVAEDVHTAADTVARVADTFRSDADDTVKVVDSVDSTVDSVVK